MINNCQNGSYTEAFVLEALKRKNEIAVTYDNKHYSYIEILTMVCERMMRLRDAGVVPNEIVAVITEDSLDSLISILAVNSAGGAYLPIDRSTPRERIKYICMDAKINCLVASEQLRIEGWNYNLRNVILTSPIVDSEIFKDEDSKKQLIAEIRENAGDLAYVLYTSGSTGVPKGVLVSHKSLNTFRDSIRDIVEYSGTNTIFLANTSFTFDISILETIVTLSYGSRVIISTQKQRLNPKLLRELIITERVNTVQFTPTYINFLIDYFNEELEFFCNLNKILLGGEVLKKNAYLKIAKTTNADIYNCYGPTEATIWATTKKLNKNDESITIGIPLQNYEITIDALDDGIGEICIVSDAVAEGYLNKPELTGERFVATSTGTKMYRTGDLGRFTKTGDLEYMGRRDNQVKIRGFRVEIGEIEYIIESYEKVERSVVLIVNANGKESLVCFYKSMVKIDRTEMILFLRNYLSEYMIPKFFIWKTSFPVTLNGKFDHFSLKKEAEQFLSD
ncbi:amino acid adenylation domain-containing protein [Paenibacillus sp. FSL H7-0716]|uniref:AMP-dependent synthetase/ligase domain-containing protein n=1 Tax=Paenibacillus odorifer TaxID=189426 RepID=A0AB36JJ41_9BACL|nr:amino acid adenylation domain-containing protein [Paenibacillus odorifer]OME23555.1 hypothetical protein BSK47_03625 [Paenibacillus odorifer]